MFKMKILRRETPRRLKLDHGQSSRNLGEQGKLKGSRFVALEEEDPLKVKKKVNNRDTGSADTQEACKEMKENTNKHTHNTSIKELHMDNNPERLRNNFKHLGFDGYTFSQVRGYSGGICLPWKTDKLRGQFKVAEGTGFSISKANRLLSTDACFTNNKQDWKNIWQLQVPERIRLFIWLVAQEGLKTKHLPARRYFGDRFCLDFPGINEPDWLDLNFYRHISYNKSGQWKEIWATTFHYLWHWRNQQMFVEDYVMPQNSTKVIKDKVQSYCRRIVMNKKIAVTNQEEMTVHWKPTNGSWITLNTNGAVNKAR
ncbi:hypothetical protein KIW84_030782 [Lathyrus oleraceus]|uniref:Reverse transcriptase zinc-binding domain-containing protein n=1 Tax=Pisum sativum TaxID=3888 RepID=A0A9D4XQL2_PEA|nr:hypothetical protein KIW84_030782 [Pisum sativum]